LAGAFFLVTFFADPAVLGAGFLAGAFFFAAGFFAAGFLAAGFFAAAFFAFAMMQTPVLREIGPVQPCPQIEPLTHSSTAERPAGSESSEVVRLL
jgi:hypothetical protein